MINSSDKVIDFVTQSLERALKDKNKSLHEPYFKGNESLYVNECITSTFVSSVGNYVNKFEQELENITSSKFAIATVNGTSALHLSLVLKGVSLGTEVLVPSLTFVGTVNAIKYCGAIPHFIDSEENSFSIDVDKLRKYLESNTRILKGKTININSGNEIKALIVVHVFGHIGDMFKLKGLCKDFNLVLIEDAAEAIGSYLFDKHAGKFGDICILSFNGNKTVTTGGGGAILTNDEEVALRAQHLSRTARIKNAYYFEHDEVGYNYRMPNINAALGCAQLENLSKILELKRSLYNYYFDFFENISDVLLFREPENCRSNYWLQTLLLKKSSKNMIRQIIENTNKIGIQTRPVWRLIHSLKPYIQCPKMDLTQVETLANRIINLPSSPSILSK